MGDLAICQGMRDGHYVYGQIVVKDTIIGRQIKRFFDWLNPFTAKTALYDGESLGMSLGEPFPWWSLTYWLIYPIKWANRFGRLESPDWFGREQKGD